MSEELPLRRQVAEALGYSVYHYSKGHRDYWMLMDPEYNAVVWHPFREGERASETLAWLDLPAFDTDYGAAFTLVDEVRDQGYQWELCDRTDHWVVYVWPKGKRRTAGDVMEFHPSLPAAICRAIIAVTPRIKKGTRYA